jgi:hypothetical protein
MKLHALVLASLVAAAGCTRPRLAPLAGAPVPVSRLPRATLAPGRHKLVFDWELGDRDLNGRGEGVARVAAPDSARLDFFLAGGMGSGAAILIGDSITYPAKVVGGDMVRRLVPPPPLLWAVLGRVALPNLPDTVLRIEGTTLRADVGRPVAWRLTFRGDTLGRVERVDDGRVAEWIERTDSTHIRYRNEGSRRSLKLTVTRIEEAPPFDASIWRFDR